MKLKLISAVGVSLLCLLVNAQTKTNQPTKAVKIDAIPHDLVWTASPKSFEVTGENSITITASAKTDYYHFANGEFSSSSAPLLLFEADDEFVLTAAVEVGFKEKFDGGFLMVYDDTNHYAKLLFEYSNDKDMIYASCVTNGVGDDNVHRKMDTNKVYFRIGKQGKVVVFYVSEDGKNWSYVRVFRFESENPLKLGFASQSPMGEQCTSIFTEINYSPKTFTDFWTGN